MKELWAAVRLVQEAVWPRRVICLCCPRPSRGGHLCAECQEKLDALRITGPVCKVCGRPAEAGRCALCDGKGIATTRSVWTYQDESRALVHALKFGAIAEAASAMAAPMAELARELSLPPETVVTWPTMPAARAVERGIDHGRLLAEAVGSQLGLPVRQLLTRSEHVAAAPQVGMGRAERLTRLNGAFACEMPLNGPVLLVDDVTTTSATATACAKCLLEAGASAVTVITAAQTARPSRSKEDGEGIKA